MFQIINAILIGLTNCFQKQEERRIRRRGAISFIRDGVTNLATTLKNTVNFNLYHFVIIFLGRMKIIYMYQIWLNITKRIEICTSDVTNGTPLMLKIFEYCPSQMARLRRHHGFNKDFLIKAFAPLFNSYEMEKFSPGAGKSPSFSSSQLIRALLLKL